MGEGRGSIAFFSTYRPPVPLNIYSCPYTPSSSSRLDKGSEMNMTDGKSYNYNGQSIPASALKTMLRNHKVSSHVNLSAEDVDEKNVTALTFVSERGYLEDLHICLNYKVAEKPIVFNFSDIYGLDKGIDGVRMEDHGCVAGNYLVYVSTKQPKDPVKERRRPWNAVYKTHLETGKTEMITSKYNVADMSPSVSPSGKRIAVATFQRKRNWNGEIEDLKTDIHAMNVESPPRERKSVILNGGWPTWGAENIIFFHRAFDINDKDGKLMFKRWKVFRADISQKPALETQITPDDIDAFTPVAINDTDVAVITVRKKSGFGDERDESQYRHIEVFSMNGGQPRAITINISPKADHYNPFIINSPQGMRIGYHRCNLDMLEDDGSVPRHFDRLGSPLSQVGVFRVSGVFPTFTRDGSKLAFVDNEFKGIWLVDDGQLRVIYQEDKLDMFFSPVWNQNPDQDTLYVCKGNSFQQKKNVDIISFYNVSQEGGQSTYDTLTNGFNNAFPSTNPKGDLLVFRSTRSQFGPDDNYPLSKNLYIMDAINGENAGPPKRLTNGPWVDTHCQWSPREDCNWIVFASSRGKPTDAAPSEDTGLDAGYFSIYLVDADKSDVVIRVIGTSVDDAKPQLPGHVNHPFFSPDGMSLVFTGDLAGVSADPISLPLFVHSVRPYGDIFTLDLDKDDIMKNKNVKKFLRITHSRYENSTAAWTMFSTKDPMAVWSTLVKDQMAIDFRPACPYTHSGGAESWHMTGHLQVSKRCC